jgi:hypothetical protein
MCAEWRVWECRGLSVRRWTGVKPFVCVRVHNASVLACVLVYACIVHVRPCVKA